ncbi:MAG: oligosaccharide flippase family protein [Oscillospiraceae bacterium]|nr:oligosaccharide flippase family protein [Oscillospiraceae bacterium]
MPSLKKNIFYQNAYQVITTLLPMITVPYVTRVLGAENIGIYSYTFSITTFFVIFAMLGINIHGSRAIAMVRDNKKELNKTFSDLFFLHLGVSLLVLLAYIIFLVFIANEFHFIFTILIFHIIAALLNITWFFTGIEEFKLMVTRNTAIRIIITACVFIFVKNSDDLRFYTFIFAFGEFVSQAILWFFKKKFVSLVKPTLSGIKSHIKPIFILFVSVISVSVYHQLNKVILGSMSDKVQLGYFEISMSLISVFLGFIYAFNGAVLPRISNITANKENSESANYIIFISMKYLMFGSFALAFGLAGVSNNFVPLFLGAEFIDSKTLVSVLCITIPLCAFQNTLNVQYIIVNSKDKILAITTIAGALVNIVINLILIPVLQAMGAVVGMIAVNVVQCIIFSLVARKELPIRVYIKNSIFFIITGFVMFLLVRFIGEFMAQNIISLLIQIGVGALFYISASSGYLYVTKDEFFINNINKFIKIIGRK